MDKLTLKVRSSHCTPKGGGNHEHLLCSRCASSHSPVLTGFGVNWLCCVLYLLALFIISLFPIYFLFVGYEWFL